MNTSIYTTERMSSFGELIRISDVIIVDTCSLLHNGFWELVVSEGARMISAHRKFYVLKSAVTELEKLTVTGDHTLRNNAEEVLIRLNDLITCGLAVVTGEIDNAAINDEQIIEYAIRYRTIKRIAVVTQDNDLAADLLNVNQLRSFDGNEVTLFGWNKNNILCRRIAAA